MFNVKFSVRDSFPVVFSPPGPMKADFAETIEKYIGEFFDGPYEYTPAAEAQTVPINGMVATSDIVINAIPNNYGLITWNGSTLTVS